MAINPGEIMTQALKVVEPVTGSLSDAWQAVVGDRIAAWRLRNAAKIQIQVLAEMKRLGLSLNFAHVPERYAFAWFEEATKQDEPEIQSLFARLLAKAAAGDGDSADRRHLEIVSRLTPADARIMDFFFVSSTAKRNVSKGDGVVTDVEIDEWELYQTVRDTFDKSAWQSVEHLTALGVLERRYSVDSDSVMNVLASLRTDREGEVFREWGSSSDFEIKPYVASTVSGLALHKALSG